MPSPEDPDQLPANDRPDPQEAEEASAPGADVDADPLDWSAEPNEPA